MESLKLELGLMKPMEDFVSSTTTTIMATNNTSNTTERRARPQKEQAVNCPRCNSTNTKFCYYNNYSLTQPRYFCKTCRRYWTEGGTLRNVPVGGGSRKNKRHPASAPSLPSTTNINNTVTSSSSSAAEASPAALNTSKKLHAEHLMPPQDLNLAFNHPAIGQLNDVNSNSNKPTGSLLPAVELLRSEMAGRSIGTTFLPMQMQMSMQDQYHHPIAFGMQEFRPHSALGFHLDGVGGAAAGYGNLQGVQGRSNGRLLFPFEQPKHEVSDGAAHFEPNKGQAHVQDPPGYWQGMIGGGEGSWLN